MVVQLLQGIGFVLMALARTLPEMLGARAAAGAHGRLLDLRLHHGGTAARRATCAATSRPSSPAMTLGQVLGPPVGAMAASRVGFQESFHPRRHAAVGLLRHRGLRRPRRRGARRRRRRAAGRTSLLEVATVCLLVLAGSTPGLLPHRDPAPGAAAARRPARRIRWRSAASSSSSPASPPRWARWRRRGSASWWAICAPSSGSSAPRRCCSRCRRWRRACGASASSASSRCCASRRSSRSRWRPSPSARPAPPSASSTPRGSAPPSWGPSSPPRCVTVAPIWTVFVTLAVFGLAVVPVLYPRLRPPGRVGGQPAVTAEPSRAPLRGEDGRAWGSAIGDAWVVRDVSAVHSARRALHPARPLRMRQDHAPPHARGLRPARRRPHRRGRRAHRRGPAAGAQCRHGLPELRRCGRT